MFRADADAEAQADSPPWVSVFSSRWTRVRAVPD